MGYLMFVEIDRGGWTEYFCNPTRPFFVKFSSIRPKLHSHCSNLYFQNNSSEKPLEDPVAAILHCAYVFFILSEFWFVYFLLNMNKSGFILFLLLYIIYFKVYVNASMLFRVALLAVCHTIAVLCLGEF